ncbi:MAG TPA: glucose-1-phosphate adenylyltransferase [Saprospiraceae bacterium]|nr:glucose-1-phosphate adenylyltransferase [Saprospiraceae bacterium]MCB9328104.1 glucose-1-phosphate adenylyltransferase [Lewinellaceae bacterium]HPK09026.1 glucose-1-phosphate adenylyltransferase [Saprospiraceae bacterium]HPQ20198.1 glucose-1-phosphate adenylyltransferase [Saprospiraceae bacterium]HRX29565.1 glucose-1-phosphate adenylyltransferase [Saprospiraceae bacterium]
MQAKVVAVILGGGVGSRLYPLTAHRSKPAVPLAGKYRLIDIPLSNCINSNINKIYVLTMFNSASLNSHIKRTYQFDKFSNGFVDIIASEQTLTNKNWFQGTSDAVKQSMKRINSTPYDICLVLSGDQLYQMDFEEVIDKHIAQNADLTVATIPVTEKEATGFGILKVDGNDNIVNFIEKPDMSEVTQWKSSVDEVYKSQNKEYLASMGIYVFNKGVMEKLFEENPDAIDFGKEIIPYAVKHPDYNVKSHSFGGYWTDIGTLQSYFEASLGLTGWLPKFHLYDNERIVYTNARLLAPTKIFGTKINFGQIADGCIIHAEEISRSIVGIRSRIGRKTIIRDTILMGNDFYQTLAEMEQLDTNELLGIGNNCFIQNAIIDKNARIGHNVYIKGDESLPNMETENYCIREGLVVVKKSAHIANGTRIGLED